MRTRQEILAAARSLKGYTNYKMGAKHYNFGNNPTKPKLLDCSGFVVWCYKQADFTVPDGTYMQWQDSYPVAKKDLKIGDIGIKEKNGVGMYNHIGIYAGDGKWIHCNYSQNGVTEETTNIFKYPRRFKNIEFTEETKPVTKAGKDKEVPRIIQIQSGGKIPTVNSINVEGKEYVCLRDLQKLGIIKLDYDKTNKRPIIEKAD